jgi:hypothetical protein
VFLRGSLFSCVVEQDLLELALREQERGQGLSSEGFLEIGVVSVTLLRW